MSAKTDDSQLPDARDEGWDETLLVWNAKVARIRPSVVEPDSAEAAAQSGTEDDRLRPRNAGNRTRRWWADANVGSSLRS